jgi:hypothetical protein
MIMRDPKHRASDGARLRPREPYYTDASASRRRSNGNDGVVEMHGEIVVIDGDRTKAKGKELVGCRRSVDFTPWVEAGWPSASALASRE